MSFFADITRYPVNPASDPGEDRLTEIFAAVINEVRVDFALRLVGAWFGSKETVSFGERHGLTKALNWDAVTATKTVHAKTQVPLAGRFVDLELRLTPQKESELSQVVRVEVKHGTSPHSGQIVSYEERSGDGPTVPVVILAPASSLPFTDKQEAPETAPQRSWEGVARVVSAMRGDPGVGLDERERWLLKEFHKYLDEEGLTPMESMNQDHVGALAIRRQTDRVMEGLLDAARHHIELQWGEDPTLPGKGEGLKFWRHYPRRTTNDPEWHLPQDAWLEFKVSTDSTVPGSSDVHFIAGLSWKARTPPQLDEACWAGLAGAKFEAFREAGCERWMRVSSPGDYLLPDVGATLSLEVQGQVLGQWVVDAFQTATEIVAQYYPRSIG